MDPEMYEEEIVQISAKPGIDIAKLCLSAAEKMAPDKKSDEPFPDYATQAVLGVLILSLRRFTDMIGVQQEAVMDVFYRTGTALNSED